MENVPEPTFIHYSENTKNTENKLITANTELISEHTTIMEINS